MRLTNIFWNTRNALDTAEKTFRPTCNVGLYSIVHHHNYRTLFVQMCQSSTTTSYQDLATSIFGYNQKSLIFNLETSCWCLDCPRAITGNLRTKLNLSKQQRSRYYLSYPKSPFIGRVDFCVNCKLYITAGSWELTFNFNIKLLDICIWQWLKVNLKWYCPPWRRRSPWRITSPNFNIFTCSGNFNVKVLIRVSATKVRNSKRPDCSSHTETLLWAFSLHRSKHWGVNKVHSDLDHTRK